MREEVGFGIRRVGARGLQPGVVRARCLSLELELELELELAPMAPALDDLPGSSTSTALRAEFEHEYVEGKSRVDSEFPVSRRQIPEFKRMTRISRDLAWDRRPPAR
jgi:hypothetical protein